MGTRFSIQIEVEHFPEKLFAKPGEENTEEKFENPNRSESNRTARMDL